MTSAPPRTPSSTGKSYSMLPPVPAPLQRLFDLFPLRTLPANALPAGSPSFSSSDPALFVFTTEDGARRGAPSFNPSCLKWQTYLRARRVPHRTVPSNNHASPSGALPFLIVAPQPRPEPEPKTGRGSRSSTSTQQRQQPKYITTSALPTYIASHAPTAPAADHPPQDPRAAFYTTLLETAVRPAYLHALYISPQNLPLMQDLYVNPSTRSQPVRASLSRQLRSAAEAEVRRALASAGHSPLDAEDPAKLLSAARTAFAALAELLADSSSSSSSTTSEEGQQQHGQQKDGPVSFFFFGGDGQGGPGLFDASVFAYTHLLLGGELAWADRELALVAGEFPALVEHRRRVYEACWGPARSG